MLRPYKITGKAPATVREQGAGVKASATKSVFKDGVGYDSAKLIESVRGYVGLH